MIVLKNSSDYPRSNRPQDSQSQPSMPASQRAPSPSRFHLDHALWSGWSQTFKTGLPSRSQQRGGNTPLFYVSNPFSRSRSAQRFIKSVLSSRNCALSYAWRTFPGGLCPICRSMKWKGVFKMSCPKVVAICLTPWATIFP